MGNRLSFSGRFASRPAYRLPDWLQRLPRWAWVLLGLAAVGLGALPTLVGGRPQPAAPGLPGSDTISTVSLGFGVFLKLGIVVLLIYVSLYLLKRWSGAATAIPHNRLAVLESAHLSPRQALHLVRVGEQVLLIGATDAAVNVLAQLDGRLAELPSGQDPVGMPTVGMDNKTPGQNHTPASSTPGFAAILRNAFEKR